MAGDTITMRSALEQAREAAERAKHELEAGNLRRAQGEIGQARALLDGVYDGLRSRIARKGE